MRLSPRRLAEAYLAATNQASLDELPNVARALVTTVTRRRQGKLLPRIMAAVEHLWHQRHGTLPVRVTTARAIEQTALTTAVGRDALVAMNVDSALIGGAIIERGNDRIDGSVRTHLRRLQQRLVGNQAERP
ncbi:MAG: F0F1 ATP synthase subunit delta [Candidatus Kerfeldbacteria bacterium]|nr:F0F1 ATP synthase subunit delta [Candidatus Kerfeldbacteria bacterium]